MTERYFVTGTDTEVGKTVVSCALLQAAAKKGYRTAGYKPVASGSEMTPDGIRNGDALALQRNSSVNLRYEQVNPYVFLEPTSPHILSEEQGVPLDFGLFSQGLRTLEQQADWLLVEGAGGWFTPLSAQHTYADWVIQEQLPVILVVGIRLGCINHALLTAQAIQSAGLRCTGWVANNMAPPGKRHAEYLATLTQRLAAPLLGEIPWLVDDAEFQHAGRYLNLDKLA